jgi:hypothetical protein
MLVYVQLIIDYVHPEYPDIPHQVVFHMMDQSPEFPRCQLIAQQYSHLNSSVYHRVMTTPASFPKPTHHFESQKVM